MTLSEFIDQNREQIHTPLRPIWVDNAHKSKKKTIAWFQEFLPVLETFVRPNIEDMYSNLLWYTGEYVPMFPLRVRHPDGRDVEIKRQLKPFVVNHLAKLTDKRAADLSVFKSTFEARANELRKDEQDRVTARTTKLIVDHLRQANDVDALFNDAEKWNMVFGHIYMGVEENAHKGDKILDKKGVFEKRAGQVETKLIEPWYIIPWPMRRWERVPCVIQVLDIIHVEEARKRYNDNKIEPHGERTLYGFAAPFLEEIRPDDAVIYRIIYRPDEFLPEGAVITMTREHVIESITEKYPWSHGDFPFVRYTDIDVPGRLLPISFYTFAKPLQHTYNNLSGLIKKYIFTVAHPKWTMERGIANIKSLGNASAVIQHTPGRPAPVLQQPRSIGSDPFAFRQTVLREMELMGDIHEISRGSLPPNTRSGIMISRLQQIEQQARGPQIDKRNKFMRDVLLMMASVASDTMPTKPDEVLEKIVGKENVDDVKALASVKFSSEYDILIQNATGFSDQMAGRLEEISFIRQQLPGLITPQQELDIIGIKSPQKYYDIGTAALRAAERENGMMDDGTAPPSPIIQEDHISHWVTHMTDMQGLAFKKLPKRHRRLKEEHLLATEELMEQVADKNPVYREKLLALDGYPRLYTPTPQPQETLPQEPPGVAPPMEVGEGALPPEAAAIGGALPTPPGGGGLPQ